MFARVARVACLLLFGLSPVATLGQETSSEKVRFTSCDGVTLRGDFYAGRGRNPAPVLLLHELGEGRDKWQRVAEALAQKGYAVLAFDFRGHGDSTEVDADVFWGNRVNKSLVRAQARDEVNFKEFDPAYYPILVNDIAAAKAYLDQSNDGGECNSSNLIVIGSQRGATLGALWINSEFHRFQVQPPQFFGQAPQVSNTAEGKKILCSLWLDIQPQLGKRKVNLPSLLYRAGVNGKLPMVFFYGDDDKEGKRIATECEKYLTSRATLPFTGKTEIPESKGKQGAGLLEKKQALDAVIDYLGNVREENGNTYVKHDSRKSAFVWAWQRGYSEASKIGSEALNFNTYEGFLPTK